MKKKTFLTISGFVLSGVFLYLSYYTLNDRLSNLYGNLAAGFIGATVVGTVLNYAYKEIRGK